MRKDLKSYVRFDGSGQIIPGSNILSRVKPKVGKWEEGPAYMNEYCCTTTSTTTTAAPICVTYTVVPVEGTVSVYFTDCEGQAQILEVAQEEAFCALIGTIDVRGDASVTLSGYGCLTTTTTTSTTTTTPP